MFAHRKHCLPFAAKIGKCPVLGKKKYEKRADLHENQRKANYSVSC